MDHGIETKALTGTDGMNIHSQKPMPILSTEPAPSPSPKKASRKREDILEAALALFVDRGFHGTAVPALAQRANVGAGTIYRYFENKEALVNELFRQWKTAIAEHVTAGFDPSLAPRQLFAEFWGRTVEFAVRHPRAFAFLELHHHSSYLDDKSRAVEESVVTMARGLIESMKTASALKNMPAELLMSVIYGALIGFVRGSWEGRYALNSENSADAEECAWSAIAS